MAEDSIPKPPEPVGDLKEKNNSKKGLFGFLKSQKNGSSQLKKTRELPEIKAEKNILEDSQGKEEELQKPELHEELLPPEDSSPISSKEDLDFEALDKLENDFQEETNKIDAQEKLLDEESKKEEILLDDLKELENGISNPLEEESLQDLDSEEEIVESAGLGQVKKKEKKESSNQSFKKEAKKQKQEQDGAEAKVEIVEKTLPKIEIPGNIPEIKVSKKPLPKPRKKVEKYIKDIENDHKKIHNVLNKAIQSPEESIDPAHFFILKNGRSIKNLHELVKALKTIDEDTFRHHVNDHKNDFANWLKDILKKEELADEIRAKKAKNELLKILDDYDKKTFLALKKKKEEMIALKIEQQQTIEKVKKARDELYKFQEDLYLKEKELKARAAVISKSKAFDVEGFKKKLEQAYIAKEKRLMNAVENQKKSVDIEKKRIAAEKSSFEKTKKEIQEMKKKCLFEMGQFEKKQKSINALKEKLDSSLRKVREKEVALNAKESEILRKSKSLDLKERVIQRKEEKLESIYNSDKELQRSISEMRQKLQMEKEAIEREGFKEYVREELGQLYPQHINQVTNIDGSMDMAASKHADLHEMILECRKLLNNNKLSDAQRFYNNIKDEFKKRKIGIKEREDIHNKILELYDDIHLAMMS